MSNAHSYIFVFGKTPLLSLVEVESVFELWKIDFKLEFILGEIAVVSTDQQLDLPKFQARLGGVIKIGKVFWQGEISDYQKAIRQLIDKKFSQQIGRWQFGFSYYGTINPLTEFGLSVKKQLSASGRPVRLVVSKEKSLSAVILHKEKMLDQGLDCLLIVRKNLMIVGETITYQDWQGYSGRDYGRPSRDDRSGMLPPKLAQMMVNLAQPTNGGLFLDPFCGSGTILQEALNLGVNNLLGSDISEKAIKDSQTNLKWWQTKTNQKPEHLKIVKCDVKDINKIVSANTVEVICTEPFLGPANISYQTESQQQQNIKQLEDLYLATCQSLYKLLKPNGRLVMIWPIILDKKISILPQILALGYQKKTFNSTDGQIIYSRPGQAVKREVLVFVKK